MIDQLSDLSGIGTVLAKRIAERLGGGHEKAALNRIQIDPYCLLEVNGVGFKRADTIAIQDYRRSPDDPRRHEHGNRSILEDKGSLSFPDYRRAREQLGLRTPSLELAGTTTEDGRVWLPDELEAEKFLARWALGVLETPAPVLRDDSLVSPADRHALTGLDDEQARAARRAFLEPAGVVVITGSAGTGKTATIAAIAKLAANRHQHTQVLAFAGKAAERAREALDGAGAPGDASTIHKALQYDGYQYAVEQLDGQVVIVDEMSMVPTRLLADVVRRLRPGATLVLVGDERQLPPIGAGTPFSDLIAAGVPRAHLEKNYRQADEQAILDLSKAIRARIGEPHLDGPSAEVHADLELDAFNSLADQAIEACRELPLDRWQCVVHGNHEREEANLGIQDTLNPRGQMIFSYRNWKIRDSHPYTEVRVGDKVMITTNDYDLQVFNGQTGIVRGLSERWIDIPAAEPRDFLDEAEALFTDRPRPEPKKLLAWVVDVQIGGRLVPIPLEDASRLLTLGYAITVHKGQGSGWEHVLILCPRAVRYDSNRWWYTAVTRAERRLKVVTTMSRGAWWRNATRAGGDTTGTLYARVGRGRLAGVR